MKVLQQAIGVYAIVKRMVLNFGMMFQSHFLQKRQHILVKFALMRGRAGGPESLFRVRLHGMAAIPAQNTRGT